MRIRRVVFALLIICSGLGIGAVSADKKGSARGRDYFMTVESESFEVGDHRVVRTKSTGFVVGDPPFSMVNQTCFGTEVTSADGTVALSGYCDAHDADGDMYWNSYSGSAAGGTWSLTGGTGKFAGIDGGGTWKAGPRFADGKWTVVWKASWEKE